MESWHLLDDAFLLDLLGTYANLRRMADTHGCPEMCSEAARIKLVRLTCEAIRRDLPLAVVGREYVAQAA